MNSELQTLPYFDILLSFISVESRKEKCKYMVYQSSTNNKNLLEQWASNTVKNLETLFPNLDIQNFIKVEYQYGNLFVYLTLVENSHNTNIVNKNKNIVYNKNYFGVDLISKFYSSKYNTIIQKTSNWLFNSKFLNSKELVTLKNNIDSHYYLPLSIVNIKTIKQIDFYNNIKSIVNIELPLNLIHQNNSLHSNKELMVQNIWTVNYFYFILSKFLITRLGEQFPVFNHAVQTSLANLTDFIYELNGNSSLLSSKDNIDFLKDKITLGLYEDVFFIGLPLELWGKGKSNVDGRSLKSKRKLFQQTDSQFKLVIESLVDNKELTNCMIDFLYEKKIVPFIVIPLSTLEPISLLNDVQQDINNYPNGINPFLYYLDINNINLNYSPYLFYSLLNHSNDLTNIYHKYKLYKKGGTNGLLEILNDLDKVFPVRWKSFYKDKINFLKSVSNEYPNLISNVMFFHNLKNILDKNGNNTSAIVANIEVFKFVFPVPIEIFLRRIKFSKNSPLKHLLYLMKELGNEYLFIVFNPALVFSLNDNGEPVVSNMMFKTNSFIDVLINAALHNKSLELSNDNVNITDFMLMDGNGKATYALYEHVNSISKILNSTGKSFTIDNWFAIVGLGKNYIKAIQNGIIECQIQGNVLSLYDNNHIQWQQYVKKSHVELVNKDNKNFILKITFNGN